LLSGDVGEDEFARSEPDRVERMEEEMEGERGCWRSWVRRRALSMVGARDGCGGEL